MRDQTSELADWLGNLDRDNALPPNAPPSTARAFAPKKATIEIQVKVRGKDRKVLYWAAKARTVTDKVMNAPDSYGRYPNMGIAHVRNGTLKMRLRAPRAYRESNKTWPPHVHYSTAAKNGGWGARVWAVAAYPGHHGKAYGIKCIDHGSRLCSFLTPSQVKRNWENLVVVNALGNNFDISKMKSGKRVQTFGGLSEAALGKRCGDIQDKPYVVYCANEGCKAAKKLITKMVALNCPNAYYMPAGKEGWVKCFKK
jgi:hypothetical protein